MTQQDESVMAKYKKNRNVPEMPEPGEYPTNHVFRTPGGIVRIECDDLGKQSITEIHPSGNIKIIHPDGSVVQTTVGETKFEYGSQTVTVKHNQDINVGGKMKTHVEGGMWTEIMGNMDVTVGQGAHVNVLGDAAVAINGNAQIAAKKNLNLDAQGDLNLRSKGAMTLGSDGGMKIQSTRIEIQPEGDGAAGYNMGRNTQVASVGGGTSSPTSPPTTSLDGGTF